MDVVFDRISVVFFVTWLTGISLLLWQLAAGYGQVQRWIAEAAAVDPFFSTIAHFASMFPVLFQC